jgi:ATP-dependent protease ClpP protease subunit
VDKHRVRTARPFARLRAGRADWFRIENTADDGSAAVYIYDEIGYFGVTAADFVTALAAVRAQKLDVHISSPGGEVYDGLAIYNAIKQHPARTTVYIDGIAASAASFIAMAGDEVVIARTAEMMIHDAMGLVIGNSADMVKMVEDLDRISNNIAGIYAARAGGEPSDWRALMLAETWYSGPEAVAAGLVDRIDGETADPGEQNSFDLSVFNYAGRESAPDPATVEMEVAELPPFDIQAFRAAFRKVSP